LNSELELSNFFASLVIKKWYNNKHHKNEAANAALL
jgi:hypothetical protein